MNKKIGLKDIVLITLLTAIMIGIQTVVLMPFITNLKFVIWFVGGIDVRHHLLFDDSKGS